jgi:hypothetical protein
VKNDFEIAVLYPAKLLSVLKHVRPEEVSISSILSKLFKCILKGK